MCWWSFFSARFLTEAFQKKKIRRRNSWNNTDSVYISSSRTVHHECLINVCRDKAKAKTVSPAIEELVMIASYQRPNSFLLLLGKKAFEVILSFMISLNFIEFAFLKLLHKCYLLSVFGLEEAKHGKRRRKDGNKKRLIARPQLPISIHVAFDWISTQNPVTWKLNINKRKEKGMENSTRSLCSGKSEQKENRKGSDKVAS